jgi:hypothetical protein
MNIAGFVAHVATLEGQRVSQVTIAGNTVLIWIGVDPKHPEARCLWLDPPWRISSPSGFHVGSAEFPIDENQRNEFEEKSALCRVLVGQSISRLIYEPTTSDLELAFSGGYGLKLIGTIASEETWHLSDYATHTEYVVSPGSVDEQQFDP